MQKWMVLILVVFGLVLPLEARAAPLKLTLTEGVIQPIPYAAPVFVAENSAAEDWSAKITALVIRDLNSSGLFREVSKSKYISQITSFASPVQYSDWKAINVQALVTGAVTISSKDQLVVKFRSYDVFAGQELGDGLQFVGTKDRWRRIAHKVADSLYSRITGESGYFDSRIVYVAEKQRGTMSFAPRFSPDGGAVVYSVTKGGNTDIYRLVLGSGQSQRLTTVPSIETAPSFSPDGRQIVFESDRSGTQQLYIMPVSGGDPRRISFGKGRYGTPVWSPRGDMIAFTKQSKGRFPLGVRRFDGSEERLLTASFLDEGPTWSPNGRVIMFTRETRGAQGSSGLYSIDVSGRNLKPLRTPHGASDPSWSPLGK